MIGSVYLNFEDVFERFLILADLDHESGEKYSFLCDDAIETINKLLKPETIVANYRSRLTSAAAALCCYKFSMIEMAKEPESFSAGDLRFGFGDTKFKNTLRLWEDAKKDISDLIYDNDFAFITKKYGG